MSNENVFSFDMAKTQRINPNERKKKTGKQSDICATDKLSAEMLKWAETALRVVKLG
jgi:hypothetical protein